LMACGFVLMGGAGRAKGLGGPCAPADNKAPADGEGGGSTTPWAGICCCWPVTVVPGCEVLVSSSAVPPSSPDCSLGICNASLGRFASDWFVFDRLGALICGTAGTLSVRCIGCGDFCGARPGCGRGDTPFGLSIAASFSRCNAAVSIECDRGPPVSILIPPSDRGGSTEPQAAASIDRLSSIGVNMLCDFWCAGRGLG